MAEQSKIFRERFIDDASPSSGALAGIRMSIKDTFDVAGYATKGGSKLLGHRPAAHDAVVVAQLRAHGASLIGHTTMTELAYSGLGLNPHFGTPENPLLPGHIPGGSTSGGAVSVALNLADVALGTDTGGSLRIPAAFCGLTGFKPTQDRFSREGCLPLSQSLDSVGVMAKDVAMCQTLWSQLARDLQPCSDLTSLRFVVPTNFGMDGLAEEVRLGFEAALAVLAKQGVQIEHRAIPALDNYANLPIWQFSAVESRRYYQNQFDVNDEQLDPRVRSRIARGVSVTDEAFAQTCQARQALIESFNQSESNSVLLLPTVAITPPSFQELEQDADYDRINLLCLRNTTLANVLDGCSVSLPWQTPSGLPMGVMLTMSQGLDEALLAQAATLEAWLQTHG